MSDDLTPPQHLSWLTAHEIPSARITGDKDRENPVEGAPYGEGLIGRIDQLEHDLALARRGWAYAQDQQLRLMTERSDARDVLAWYADQFCEFGHDNAGCGKFSDDVCSGCKARALVMRGG